METSIFMTNRTQAVRLPTAMRFDDSVKKVNVRIVGHERILSPVGKSWDSFFLAENTVSDDFMADRENAYQSERESL